MAKHKTVDFAEAAKRLQPAIADVFAKHGFDFRAEDTDVEGLQTLRLYRNGQPSQVLAGSLLQAADDLIKAVDSASASGPVKHALGPIANELRPLVDQPFEWNASAMLRK